LTARAGLQAIRRGLFFCLRTGGWGCGKGAAGFCFYRLFSLFTRGAGGSANVPQRAAAVTFFRFAGKSNPKRGDVFVKKQTPFYTGTAGGGCVQLCAVVAVFVIGAKLRLAALLYACAAGGSFLVLARKEPKNPL
jgi:hypothetical protein